MSSKILLPIFVGFGSLILSGCSSNTTIQNPCSKIVMPKWTNDDYVGVSRITASSSKTDQKKIALQRALSLLLMKKGTSQGKTIVSINNELHKLNQKEFYSKNFKQNSSVKITFQDINYDIKITDTWQDPCTNEMYVKIKENK